MFVYYIEDEKKQEYLKKIKEESKSLNYESQKFLEIAFCDEDYNKQEDNSSSDSSEEIEKEFLKDDSDNKSSSDVEDENTIAEDTVDDEKASSEYDDSNYRNSPIDIIIKKLEDKEVWTLEDIFPKKIYPALDLMMGKDLREIFISACEKIVQFPYTVGYYRKMIRSTNYRNHLNNIWNILKELVCQTVLGFDVIKLLKKDFDQDRYYNSLSSEQLAIEIDRNNNEVIDIIKDMLLSENNTNILSYEVFRGIFKSDNKELVELTGKLLLAAKLQEGLRQAICENIDCGTQANFEYMFDIIYSNDLIRFSSVKRAVATFTGIGEEYGDRITKKQLELINNILNDKKQADVYLKSEDNVEAMMGLWYKGSVDIRELIKAMDSIIIKGDRHSVLLVSYYLNIIQDEKYSNKIAKTVIKKFAKDEDEFEKNDALEILACYLRFLSGRVHWYSIRRDFEENRINLSDYFNDEEEAREFFDIFEYAMKSMKKKEKVYSPCIFPWYSTMISKEDLASIMLITAIFVRGDLTDRAIGYLKQASSYYRSYIVERLLDKPQNKKQKDMVLEMLSDRTGASDEARKIILSNNMTDEYIVKIQDTLRLKTPEIRRNAIDIIYTQDEEKLLSSIEYLISQKDVNKRLAGLDLMLKAKADKKTDVDKLYELADKLNAPSSSEQVLLEQLKGGKMQDELAKELYDVSYEIDFDIKIEEKSDKPKNRTKDGNEITVINTITISELFNTKEDILFEIIKKLNDLYIANENYEYKSVYNDDTLLSNSLWPITNERNVATLKDYPLAELWEDFYKKEIRDFKTLYELYMLISERYLYERDDYTIKLKDILGFNVEALEKRLRKEKLKYFGERYNNRQGYEIISLLYAEYKKENRAFVYEASKSIMVHIYQNFDVNKLVEKNDNRWRNYDSYNTVFDMYTFMENVNSGFGLFEGNDEFREYFVIKYYMYKRFYEFGKIENAEIDRIFLGLIDYANAVRLGLVKKDEFYIEVLNRGDTSVWIRSISNYIDGSLPNKKISGYNNAINDETIAFIKEEGQKIIDYVVSIELNRGDSPTKFSSAIHSIKRIEGIDNLIKILKALGNLKLDRNSWYFSGGDSKAATLSHLLKVCYPSENDNVKKLKEELKDTDITVQRLVEVAMYSSQWIDILEQYLGWKGLASGCYYFQAHMSDVDRKKESLFAKYTPISVEDLSLGAFDVDWFNAAYKQLGEDNFNVLYESAKYISDGTKHSRARKFADAVLGKLDIDDTEAQIEDKRNKDLVASYALIPLAKSRSKNKDMLRRYKFLQKFLKDSKQFGAQRRSSEAKAVEIALDNLARNAGFSDVTRLIWAAETDLIKEMKAYFKPKKVSDITVYINIDEFGKSSIVYEKGDKKLKSLPAKLKKDKYINQLKDVQKSLKDQYSRSVKMLEESMEDGVEFYVHEIENIMKNNKVIMPLIKDLVFKAGDNLGFYNEKELVSIDDKRIALKNNDSIKIAHALDLYNSKDWAKYQKYLFDNEIKQPFKQVFRELYVKTDDELGKDTTLRYSGHQIQPAKTIAVLKTRRWVIDGEEGLQKVYYKQNIIAKIYAIADWFSPADIEAPTIEWVEFYDRKTFKKMLIDEIPDLIFTEVMRDVDLAVSVAHVGGVDPETSHSTIQLRKAIIEFNLPLFGLDNVSFTDKHALIKGSLAEYSVHLGSGLVHQKAGSVINVLPVHSQHRGKLFLPFIDEDPKTAEIMSKIVMFAEDKKIKDPSILSQINTNNL